MAAPHDAFVSTDGVELWDRIQHSYRRFDDLIATIDPALLPRGSAWTARETAGHLLTVLHRLTQRDITGSAGMAPSVAELDDLNAVELEKLRDHDLAELRAALRLEMQALEHTFPRGRDLTRTIPFHGGTRADGAAVLGHVIGEFQLHGRDLALAAGRRWPVRERDAVLALCLPHQVAGGFLRPSATGDLTAVVTTRHTRPWLLGVREGTGISRPATAQDRPDVRLHGRAGSLLLALYGRLGAPAAAARGTLVLGGRRPWLASRLPRIFAFGG